MILAGDVGATKTALAVLDPSRGPRAVVREATLPSQEIESFEEAVEAFLGGAPRVRVAGACFGVAGPVGGGRSQPVNLPWAVDEAALARRLGCPVRLLNDLEASARGALGLPDDQLLTLQAGTPERGGNMAIIAAGTGLGMALMIPEGAGYRIVPSEGGHAGFAPNDEIEIDLLRYLRAEFGHVSRERVLSGPGLHHIYGFLMTRGGHAAPDWLRHRLGSEDPAAVISEVGLADREPVCRAALDRFVRIYGIEAGNLALTALARGGLIVGGGIAPKIRGRLVEGGFMEAFRAKGRLEPLMTTIPVRVALDPRAPLWGAAETAASLAA